MMPPLFAMGLAQLMTISLAELPSVEDIDNTPQVFLVSGAQKHACQKGSVCMSATGGATMEGVELRSAGPSLVVLARGAQVAAKGTLEKANPDQPWDVQMVARFKATSSQAPVIVAIFDRADPEGIARKEANVVWTVDMNPGHDLGMRFSVSPEDGFAPSHTYYVRVVQVDGKREHILAEGDFRLE